MPCRALLTLKGIGLRRMLFALPGCYGQNQQYLKYFPKAEHLNYFLTFLSGNMKWQHLRQSGKTRLNVWIVGYRFQTISIILK